jgi:hypothetical protein
MEETSAVASLISAGGVTLLAALVYAELRMLRPILRSLDLSVQALLERERARTGPIKIPGGVYLGDHHKRGDE